MNKLYRPKLLEIYGEGYSTEETQLPIVIDYIFMTATNTSHVPGLLLPKRGDVPASNCLLEIAAEALKTLISGDRDVETSQQNDESPTRSSDWDVESPQQNDHSPTRSMPGSWLW